MQNVGLGECVENHVSPESEGQAGGGGVSWERAGRSEEDEKKKIRNVSASKPSVCFNLVSPIEKAFDGMSINPLRRVRWFVIYSMGLSRRWSRMHEIFSWPKANTSFPYLKKKFDLNTKTWTKAKPVTESRKTNDDTDHLSTLSSIGLMIPPCWNHSQKVWIYILYALGYVTANRFDCERSSLSPESSNKLMIFANG